jgi:hypothetical protein
MTQHTERQPVTGDPEYCFLDIGRVVAEQDKDWKAAAKRAFSGGFVNTIRWKSFGANRLEGNLGRQWGKVYNGMQVTFTHDGSQLSTTLQEPSWLTKARWPIYIVCGLIPPLWWLFFFNLVFHLAGKVGIPIVTRKVSRAMLDHMATTGK